MILCKRLISPALLEKGGLAETVRQYSQGAMRFCSRARRVRFAARSLKYARYVFNGAPRGRQQDTESKKLCRMQQEGSFPVLQGGRTRKYRGYILKDGSAAKPNNSPFCGERAAIQQTPTIHYSAAHCTLNVLP